MNELYKLLNNTEMLKEKVNFKTQSRINVGGLTDKNRGFWLIFNNKSIYWNPYIW